MADYQKMYYRMFNAVTDALDELDRGLREEAVNRLKKAQQDCEELYIETADE